MQKLSLPIVYIISFVITSPPGYKTRTFHKISSYSVFV